MNSIVVTHARNHGHGWVPCCSHRHSHQDGFVSCHVAAARDILTRATADASAAAIALEDMVVRCNAAKAAHASAQTRFDEATAVAEEATTSLKSAEQAAQALASPEAAVDAASEFRVQAYKYRRCNDKLVGHLMRDAAQSAAFKLLNEQLTPTSALIVLDFMMKLLPRKAAQKPEDHYGQAGDSTLGLRCISLVRSNDSDDDVANGGDDAAGQGALDRGLCVLRDTACCEVCAVVLMFSCVAVVVAVVPAFSRATAAVAPHALRRTCHTRFPLC